ncbi:MAG TPA: hypothetical protein VF659_09420 [Pyrinomonadaceae bacterium]|jgi:hypothetical protein
MSFKVTADIGQVMRLGDEYGRAAEVGSRRLAERGEQLVREEAPKRTRNLIQGVSSDVKVVRGQIRGEIVITARTGRQGRREGVLHRPGGKTKKVTLRAVPAFNYPQAVAEGTGVYSTGGVFGPRPVIRPRKARALLVPVSSAPSGEPYIVADGQVYVMRRYIKGIKPNPYHERAGARLEREAPPIFDRAVSDFVGGRP